MSSITLSIEIEEDIYEVFKAMAKLRGVSIEQVLSEMVGERIQQIRDRMHDPIIGMFDSGETDVSERDEDILHNEWQPD